MSPKDNLTRSQFVRQRRKSGLFPARPKKPVASATGRAAHPGPIHPPVAHREARTVPLRQATSSGAMRRGGDARQYAFSLGRTAVRTPSLAIPQLGTRWLSGLATALLVFVLYTLWTSSTFAISNPELHGNQRLSAAEIDAALHLVGQPIFKAVPAQIAANLHTDFPDLASIRVHVGIPNRLVIDLTERVPVLAWTEKGATTWIDANGIAFPARGTVQGLIPVAATDTPPLVETDPATPLFARPYIDPAMVKAMMTLYPFIPQGVSMTYDPTYGMGWQDARGWSVYFGQGTNDIQMKMKVYQAIVNTLTQQGIQPTLISVEYLDAPFYK